MTGYAVSTPRRPKNFPCFRAFGGLTFPRPIPDVSVQDPEKAAQAAIRRLRFPASPANFCDPGTRDGNLLPPGTASDEQGRLFDEIMVPPDPFCAESRFRLHGPAICILIQSF